MEAERLEIRCLLSADPIVTVDTNFGNFQIELRPDAAPQTVANFLQYVESGAYTDAIFHRSVPGFIEQTGGFTSSSATFSGDTSQFATIPTNAAVPLEYSLPNIAGSVAMARTSDPNSATDEWFVNLIDNTSNLGPQPAQGSSPASPGYAVFGQVLGNGMNVLNAIAALSVTNADNGSTFAQLPLGPNNELVQITSVSIDSIDGTVFSDTNSNGQLDAGEQGAAGRTVFIDQDGSGTFKSGDPTAVTDANGAYSFSGLAAGTYVVREELPSSQSLTLPAQTVTVAANQTSSGVNFAEAPSITGTVFTDTNGNGTLDAGETGVAGRTVFLNVDGTNAPDASNPSTVTDANGNYSFSGLAVGPYTVAEVSPTGTTSTTSSLTATVAASGSAPIVNIGELPPSIVGTVFTDVNGNGQFDSGDVGIAGRTVFLDTDGSGAPDTSNPSTTTNSLGQFTFSTMPAASYTVKEVLPSGGSLTTAAQTVTVAAGKTTSGVVLGERPSITGTVFVDLNGNGQLDSGEPGVGGQTVFLNIDGTGAPDASNPSTTTDSNGNFAFGTEPPASYKVQEVLSSNVTLSAPVPTVAVAAGQTASGVALGDLPAITGTVFTDANGNGTLDAGEAGVAGRTVFLNVDGSGAADSSNPSAVTDANGRYSFLGLAPASYTVNEAAPSGVTLTTSAQTVQVVAGQMASAINIGEASAPSNASGSGTASIGGILFDDLNGNGQLDPGEPGLAGRTVFLDTDGSGAPDSSNPSATTDANGNYSFSSLAAGAYMVREVVGQGQEATLTTTPQAYSLTAGQNVTGDNLGSVPASTVVPMPVSIPTAPAPSSDANTAYINSVYESVLGHAADAAGLSYWQQQMASGASLTTVAQGVWDSAEHRGNEVEQFYHEFLGRVSDPVGKQYWINAFSAWGTEQIEVVGFITSQEASLLHPGDSDFVNALYSDVAQRAADSAGLTYWTGQLANGQTRVQVAFDFLKDPETATQLIDAFYADYLHRDVDAASLQGWLNEIQQNGMSAESIGVQILATTEYFNRVTGSSAS